MSDKFNYRLFGAFPINELLGWRYCPLCGSELIEVYPGDFTGHTNCGGCDGVAFDIIKESDGEIRVLNPRGKIG